LETANIAGGLGADSFAIIFPVFTDKTLEEKTKRIFQRYFDYKQEYFKGFIRDYSGMDVRVIKEQIMEILSSRRRYRVRLYPSMEINERNFALYFDRPEQLVEKAICADAWISAQLQPNGDVACCGNFPYVVGNILRESFEKLWNGEKMESFREFLRSRLFPSCTRCGCLTYIRDGKLVR
jgi:radical SAM protein with 4Fe4S-binding SPASM domain